MARRQTITIVFGEGLTGEQYADRGNGTRSVLKAGHPDGGRRLPKRQPYHS